MLPVPLSALLIVVLGGGLGSGLRFVCDTAIRQAWPSAFPFGTLTVNVVGSAVMGLFYVMIVDRMGGDARLPARLFLMTGLLGGFTTFSAFSLDVFALIERGDLPQAALYVAASVILSVGALFAAIHGLRTVI